MGNRSLGRRPTLPVHALTRVLPAPAAVSTVWSRG